MFIVYIATKESPCADVIATQFARMSNQILQDQENVLLKMYTYRVPGNINK